MKSLILLCAIIGLSQLAASQTIPDNPDFDIAELMKCIANGLAEIPYETQAVRDWAVGVYGTVDRLVQQRRRCNEITNDRLQQACMATWTAQALFEANQLRNDLAIVTDESTADLFRLHFLDCFVVDPDYTPEPYAA